MVALHHFTPSDFPQRIDYFIFSIKLCCMELSALGNSYLMYLKQKWDSKTRCKINKMNENNIAFSIQVHSG